MKTRPSAIPLYNLTEVARYARARPENVRRWFLGYRSAQGQQSPLLTPARRRATGEAAASFENLIETAVVAALRFKGLSLQAVREAHKQAADEFGEHPFAGNDIWVAGADIFIRAAERTGDSPRILSALTKGGQRALEPVLTEYLHVVDWQEGWPVEWRPMGGVVRQNPAVVFGRPHVDGIRTEILRDRFEVGETVDDLAEDFALDRHRVEQALRYELWLRPAA